MRVFCQMGLTLALVIGCLPAVNVADEAADLQENFDPNEPVTSITLTITMDASADAVDEPLALDLGLGFPLWLSPVGQTETQAAKFGAVPVHASIATHAVEPGTSASFTFHRDLDGENHDPLHMSARLLAGLRVSDIARVGLCARGMNDWCLQSYGLKVNDKLFALDQNAFARIQDEQALAQISLNELNANILPLEQQAETLRSFVEVGLDMDDEAQQLMDIDEVLLPMLQERDRIQRQLAGSYPWFVDADFHSPWRNGDAVTELKVTLTTAAHVGADTANYVYYRTGGRKYLLTSPEKPATPDFGPQEFRLDIEAGPLTTADIRGHAVGLLGHGRYTSEVPDRWHPQHMLVEVDGRVVYDSNETDVDRLSLQAIRLIPPAHFNAAGQLVHNYPNPRETYVWIAGQAMGLDLVNGGALDLPAEDSTEHPAAETTATYTSAVVEGDEQAVADSEMAVSTDPAYEPFPGEVPYPSTWSPYGPLWDPSRGEPPWWGGPPAPAPQRYVPPLSWDDIMDPYPDPWLPYDPTLEPEPYGEPLQVHGVHLQIHEGRYRVRWQVSGNVGEVGSYTVGLVPVYLDREQWMADASGAVAIINDPFAEEYEFTDVQVTPADPDKAHTFLMPFVTAVPRPGSTEFQHVQFGPAQLWVDPEHRTLNLDFHYVSATDEVGNGAEEPELADIWNDMTAWFPPAGPEVFRIGQTLVQNGLDLDDPAPANNFVIHPGQATGRLLVGFVDPEWARPRFVAPADAEPEDYDFRLVAHLGFLNGIAPGCHIRYRMLPQLRSWRWRRLEDGTEERVIVLQSRHSQWREIASAADMNNAPLVPIMCDLRITGDKGVACVIEIEFIGTNPQHPPVIISPRLIKDPGPAYDDWGVE